jgi:hypothetical protein
MHIDEAVFLELADCPIDVHDADAECVADHFLRQGHGEGALANEPDRYAPLVEIDDECSGALERRLAANSDETVQQPTILRISEEVQALRGGSESAAFGNQGIEEGADAHNLDVVDGNCRFPIDRATGYAAPHHIAWKQDGQNLAAPVRQNTFPLHPA